MKMILIFRMLGALVLAVVAAKSKSAKTRRNGTYRQRSLMTDNEEEFFGRLVVALPDHYIFRRSRCPPCLSRQAATRK